MIKRLPLHPGLAPLVLILGVGCSGGGGGSNPGTTSFQVNGLSIQDGAVWKINREIEFHFSEPIDFSTVSSNTINIRSASDVPAIGVFRLRDPSTVVFQPNCPTRADFSDAGLRPGGVTYVLRVMGQNTSPNTLRSLTGVPLGLQQTRTFSTPASNQASIVFQDTLSGPPKPIVRDQCSAASSATYLELGGDPDNRLYFLPDDAIPPVAGADQDGDGVIDDANGDGQDDDTEPELCDQGFRGPLNLYSDSASGVAVVIEFDQPVSPLADNISENRLRLEFRDPLDPDGDVWLPLDTRVTLVANCTETGARVRLEPIGVFPPSRAVRAVVLPGFRDLVGDSVQESQTRFSLFPTRAVEFSSLMPADVLSDEFNESFEFGGDSQLSFQDTTALFDTPVADWGDGRLAAAFSFEGTGGPNGDFDWVVHQGELFFFDTTSQPIIGGRDGAPNTTVTAVNGVVDVHNFTIEAGGEVRVQGPNPMRIQATGNVVIRGALTLAGFSAKDVATLNTGNQVEVGGAGVGGGGKGGNGNENTTGPTPRGGRGQGPFRQANLGGQGGEMGISNATGAGSKNARRPGGGGGGRFTKDWIGTTTFADVSLAAEAGNNGHPSSTGVESGLRPAAGGSPGQGPFLDSNNGNDFFGVRPLVTNGEVTGLVRGELPSLWAGHGGGGGGNAGKAFPNPNWSFNSDEKGGGGGGGAGGLHIQALGRIVFGARGAIGASGGRGATGENTLYLDHIGGTGGGGSGGHLILESAVGVDFTDGGAAVASPLRDMILASGPKRKTGPQENVDTCGESRPFCCPIPNSQGCSLYSNGGAGGAGLIQIHVPDPRKPPGTTAPADILVPAAALLATNVLDQVTSPPAFVMIPTFGKRSKARSDWISIGGADRKPDGSEGLVRFLFDGIDTTTGRIETVGSTVQQRAPLVRDDDLGASTTARILPDGFTLELVGAALASIRAGATSGLSNDVYLRTPALLEDCAVRMFVMGNEANFEDFSIATAVYDEGAPALGDEALRVKVGGGRHLTEFNPGERAGFQLLPRFFQVVTNGLLDSLPSTAFVSLRFQAASDNGAGAPDEFDLLQDWTSDITQFNTKPVGALQFFRYEVEFDLDKGGVGITADTEPVTLDFLKVPFVF